jgi:hypothetical protein
MGCMAQEEAYKIMIYEFLDSLQGFILKSSLSPSRNSLHLQQYMKILAQLLRGSILLAISTDL